MRMFKVGGIGCAIVGAMWTLGGIGCLAMLAIMNNASHHSYHHQGFGVTTTIVTG